MNKTCQVFGMDVRNKRIRVQHLGNVYAFCSRQCQENFSDFLAICQRWQDKS